MAEILDDVDYLTQEVGPHPAGTEEEQRAALYIADRMQKDAGFATVVEDFQCLSNDQLPRLICFGAALLAVLLSLIVPGLGVLWLLIAIAAAVLFGMEAFGRPVLSKLFCVGASQNVVAKYQPAATGGATRRRKVILVANYDSGKVLQEEKPPIAGLLPVLQKASAIALGVSAFLLLLRTLFFSGDTGAISSIISFLLVICAILFVLPIVRSVLHTVAPFNQSANNNATGTAVLIDVARKVGNGLVSQEELMAQAQENQATVHGEEAAVAAGVVPEGAEVSYDAEMTSQESLAAAKAAIAALTGRPVADKVPVTDISAHLVKGGGLEPEDETASSVRFEESPVKPQAQRKPRPNPLARTMVSSSLEEEPVVEPIEEAPAEESVEQAAEVPAQAEAAVEAPAPEPERPSFERAVPAALTGASGFAASTGSTPSWAKKAQEKARANKPELDAPKKSYRSRYADAPAAQIAAANIAAANSFAASGEAAAGDESELSARLQAMREEIAAAEAPKFTAEPAAQEEAAVAEPSEPAAASASAPVAAEPATAASAVSAPAETVPVAPHPVVSEAVDSVAQPAVASEPSAKDEGLVSRETAVAPARSIDIDKEAIAEVTQRASSRAGAPKKPTPRVAPHRAHKIHGIAADLHAAREAEREAFDVHEENEAKAVVEKESAKPEPQPASKSEAESNSAAGVESERETATQTAPMDVVDEETVAAAATGEMPVTEAANPIDSYVEQAVSDTEPEMDVVEEEPEEPRRRSVSDAAGFARSFASRLKSITSHKPAFFQRNEEPEQPQDEYYNEEEYAEEQYAPVDNYLPEEEYVEDEFFDEGEEHYDGDEQAQETPAAGMTAAMAPIDVSQFMDQEEFEEDEQPIRHLDEVAERVAVSYDDEYAADSAGYVPAAEEQGYYNDSYSYDYENANFLPEEDEADDFSAAEPATASPILGMENMVPAIEPAETKQQGPARQVIVLPDVVATHAPAGEETRQRAPMADTNENSQAGSRALLSNMLPSIGNTGAFPAQSAPSLDLPSLGDTAANQAVSTTGSFSTVGGTGAFAPVTDELVSDLPPEEVYVDDADDSAYDEEYTETGAFAGPGYVEMPKSRAGRLFGKFRKNKKNKQPEVSVNEWVNVDESYNARSVGKARGDWSSFREEEENYQQSGDFVDVDYNDKGNGRGWNGGAFSLDRLRKGLKRDGSATEEPIADEAMAAEAFDEGYVDENPALRIDGDSATAAQINSELRKLQDFRHPDINTEVWFVALGAEQYGHSGMNAFLNEHADELRGAIVVNLEALGAGTLSCIEQEGAYQPRKISSRLKRVLRQAGEKSGVRFNMDTIASRETPAGVAMAHGVQAITIAGMADGNTALYSADNDIIENVDPKALEDASNFVMAVLKSI